MRVAKSILVAALIASGASAANAVEPDDLLVGPIGYQQDVNGVTVDLSARTYFKILTLDNKIYLKAQVIGDLGDLQRKMGTIIDSFRLPHDNCRSYSANNPVVSLPRKELRYVNGDAVLSISGTVDLWDCRENPIPNSKVEWVVENIGFGIKTKVPKVITWPGNPIKNKLASQPFDVTLPIRLTRQDELSVALNVGDPNIELKGQYALITKGILQIAGININDKAKEALQKAIDPAKLRAAIPEEFLAFNPSVTHVRFIEEGGRLAAELDMAAEIPAARVTEMIKGLVDKKPLQR